MSEFQAAIEKFNKTVEAFNVERVSFNRSIMEEYNDLHTKVSDLSTKVSNMEVTLNKNTGILEKIATDVEDTNKIKTQGKAYLAVGKFLLWLGGGLIAALAAAVSSWNYLKDHIKFQ